MLVNLVPEFLSVLARPIGAAAYHEYLDRHRPFSRHWHNSFWIRVAHASRIVAGGVAR